MKLLFKASIFLLLMPLVLVGCSTTLDHSTMDHSGMDHSSMEENGETEASQDTEVVESNGKKVITIEAKETHLMYDDELMDMAWT
jgi:uncharacterized protein involved in copper resistance